MKKLLIMLVIILLILLSYICIIQGIPNNIILFQGENFKINTVLGVALKKEDDYEAMQTSGKIEIDQITEKVQKIDLNVSLFNIFNVKNVTLNVLPKTKIIPLGDVIGLKLYTNGVLVVGMSEIETYNNIKNKPYENSGIKEGDMIIKIDENEITCTSELVETINNSKGKEVEIKFIRDNKIYETSILPAKINADEYKLGLWVRDTAAGVGTISFYDANTKTFAALGHGILDVDTEELINISNGEIITTNILSIKKGEKGNPGEIKGSIIDGEEIGLISKNTRFGIFGTLKNITALNINTYKQYEMALREEIKTGPAKIICNLDNTKKEYDIEIQKIYLNNNENNKSMIIKVTDKKLLELTGGIIQRNVTELQ